MVRRRLRQVTLLTDCVEDPVNFAFCFLTRKMKFEALI
jgi:hypothetical protein